MVPVGNASEITSVAIKLFLVFQDINCAQTFRPILHITNRGKTKHSD